MCVCTLETKKRCSLSCSKKTYNGLVGLVGDRGDTLAVAVVAVDRVGSGVARLTSNLSSEDSDNGKGDLEEMHYGGERVCVKVLLS